jgi:hypothetical protein
LDLGHGRLNDPGVHEPDLFVDVAVMITGVVDKHNSHDTVEVIWVLVIYGDTRAVLESLTNSTLKKIHVKFRKEQGVQWSLTLLDRTEVEAITHLIYSPKKIIHV